MLPSSVASSSGLADELRASIAGVLGSPRPTPAREDGVWTQDWDGLDELGVAGVLDPRHDLGAESVLVAVAVASECARALHPGPVHAILPTGLLADALPDGTLAGVALAGSPLRVGVAGDEVCLDGTLRILAGLTGLSALVVATPDLPGEVLLVDTSSSGLTARAATTLDTTRSWATVTLSGCAATRIPLTGAVALPAMYRLLVAADAVALVQLAVERTVDYARERMAFGGPIGRFQAVQHRLAEHAITATQLGDLLGAAAVAHGQGAPDADRRLLIAEVAWLQRASTTISDCIQLTGGMGFTWEYGLHFGQRRVLADAQLVGGSRRAALELAAAAGW